MGVKYRQIIMVTIKELREFEKAARKLHLIMGGKMKTKERVQYLESRLNSAMERIIELECALKEKESECPVNLFDHPIEEFITLDCNGERFELSEDYEWELNKGCDDRNWYAKPIRKSNG